MRKLLYILLLSCASAFAQNYTTVTATNIQKGGQPLASGNLCFTATDANDVAIAFRIGGGGQEVQYPFCTPITAGVIGSFQVPNPALTAPANINYRVEITSGSARLLRYTGVQFAGSTFSLDQFVPSANLPLGSSVQFLTVNTLTVTGPCPGCTSSDFSMSLEAPSTADSGKFQHKLNYSGNIDRISCSTDIGTVGINLEQRSESTPNSAGTGVMSTPLSCNASTAVTTSFASPAITANSPLALTIASVAGGATLLRVHVHIRPY